MERKRRSVLTNNGVLLGLTLAGCAFGFLTSDGEPLQTMFFSGLALFCLTGIIQLTLMDFRVSIFYVAEATLAFSVVLGLLSAMINR